MSKINKKFTVSIKGVIYVEGNVISVEDSDTGEVIPIASLIQDFNNKECNLSINYGEDI